MFLAVRHRPRSEPGLRPLPRRRPAAVAAALALVTALVLSACATERVPSEGADWLGREEVAPSRPRVVRPALREDAGAAARPAPAPPGAGPGVSQIIDATGAAVSEAAPALTRPAVGPDARIRIGLLLPLDGADGEVGRALLDAASMALFDIGDRRLEILPRDTHGTPEGAEAAVRSVLQQGVSLILGPLLASSVEAAAPVARSAGVTMISFSSDARVAGPGVFIMGFRPEAEVARILGFARERGIWRFAAMTPQSPYGRAVAAALEAAIRREGGVLMDVVPYPRSADALYEPVKRLADYDRRHAALESRRRLLAADADGDPDVQRELARLGSRDTVGNLPFDAVLLPEGGALLRALAPLLPYYDVDPKRIRFLGTGLWDDSAVEREPALLGGWFAAPPPDGAARLRARFADIFGRAPPRIVTLAYDAVALAAVLSRAEPDIRFSSAAITNASGFAGMDGIFRFQANGISERGLAVLEVRPDGRRVIDPAPETFERVRREARQEAR